MLLLLFLEQYTSSLFNFFNDFLSKKKETNTKIIYIRNAINQFLKSVSYNVLFAQNIADAFFYTSILLAVALTS